MADFIPGIEVKPVAAWAETTAKGFQIMNLAGPDIEGNWAALVKDKQGRIAAFNYSKDGKCVEDSDFDLVPSRPKHTIKFVTMALDALGMPMFTNAQDTRFPEANAAVIFHKSKLVGLKIL